MGICFFQLGTVGGRFRVWLVAKLQRVVDSPNSLYVHAHSDGVENFARLISIILLLLVIEGLGGMHLLHFGCEVSV